MQNKILEAKDAVKLMEKKSNSKPPHWRSSIVMHMARDIAVLYFKRICKNPEDRKEFITVTGEDCRDSMDHKLDDAMLQQ